MRQFLLLSLTIAITLVSCSNKSVHKPGGPYYYAEWGGYKVPFTLYNEIPPEKARGRKTYYEAFFSNTGRIVRICKYLDGAREWEDSYSYSETGALTKRVMIKSDGKMVAQYFDEKGHVIREGKE